ncbi:MAG: zf-HC2 domain-containing protein [Ignavibacteriae bacterium]|nr:zf-HC2 domain-containing protein [Ignavibacteriota bacterium]
MMNHATIKNLLYDFVMNELPDAQRNRVEVHLKECQECTGEVETLTLFVEQLRNETIDWSEQQTPAYWNHFADAVAEQIRQEEKERRSFAERFGEWLDSFISFRPRDIAITGAVCALLVVSFVVGRVYFVKEKEAQPQQQLAQQTPVVDSEYVRLHDYFRKSKALLVGLANTNEGEVEQVDLETERTLSNNLLDESRSLKRTALDPRSERLINDMEKIFLKVANGGDNNDFPELELIRNGIERENLLYKIRRAEATYRTVPVQFASDIR